MSRQERTEVKKRVALIKTKRNQFIKRRSTLYLGESQLKRMSTKIQITELT